MYRSVRNKRLINYTFSKIVESFLTPTILQWVQYANGFIKTFLGAKYVLGAIASTNTKLYTEKLMQQLADFRKNNNKRYALTK